VHATRAARLERRRLPLVEPRADGAEPVELATGHRAP